MYKYVHTHIHRPIWISERYWMQTLHFWRKKKTINIHDLTIIMGLGNDNCFLLRSLCNSCWNCNLQFGAVSTVAAVVVGLWWVVVVVVSNCKVVRHIFNKNNMTATNSQTDTRTTSVISITTTKCKPDDIYDRPTNPPANWRVCKLFSTNIKFFTPQAHFAWLCFVTFL